MPNRMLRDWTGSEKMNSVSVHAERFFIRLIMKADDYGCFYADTRLLKANLFPLLLDSVREADISRWMAECLKAGLIVLYEVDNKKYLQIEDFKQRLDRSSRKFPEPKGKIIRNQPLTNVNDFPPELEVEDEVEKSPNGLSERGSPPDFSDYPLLEKNTKNVYEYILTRTPTIPEPYVDLWNLFATKNKLPQVQKISEARRKKLRIRLKEKTFVFSAVLRKAEKSEFILKGNWFTFDWIIDNDKNYLKVLEGNYDTRDETKKDQPVKSRQELRSEQILQSVNGR